MKEQKSYYAKPSEFEHSWHHVDANGKILGRLASTIAGILRGKHKAIFTPSVDTGDFVIVTNAEKIRVTGKKLTDKKYYRHSGYPGGLTETSVAEQLQKNASKVIMDAVKGMLPHNRIGRQMLTKLKVYNGNAHPHEAQAPVELKI